MTNAADALAERGSIRISTGAESEQLVIRVADSGCGIRDEIRDRAFDPFFTTKPIGAGTGLGLSITYSIAKKHGGELELRAGDSGGTVATLRFPLAGCAPEDPAAVAHARS